MADVYKSERYKNSVALFFSKSTLYNFKNKQKQKKFKKYIEAKLHITFSSVKYACGGMPYR